jgi:hypothetical protein
MGFVMGRTTEVERATERRRPTAGTRGGSGRIVAMVVGLAVVLALAAASEARAGTYAVVACGWFVGPNASWADTTGGAKFAPDDHCVAPPGPDSITAAKLVNWTIAAGTVSGTRFARWRWQAPPGTAIVAMRAFWWHVLHDGFQQRLGTDPGNGDFVPFAIASSTDAVGGIVQGAFAPQAALEDRLLCAKPEAASCSLAEESYDGLKAITLTLEDRSPPAAAVGGPLLEAGWHRGSVPAVFWSGDLGGGVYTQDVTVDGNVVDHTTYPCALLFADGAIAGASMQPCPLGPSGTVSVDTATLSDGPHMVRSCSWDIGANGGCSGESRIWVDNTAPGGPGAVAIAGGDGWHRVNRFDLGWRDPDQAPGSPIAGARWRVTGADGYDSGVQAADGAGVASLGGVTVPGDGAWNLHLWLRDEAGNEAAASGIDVPLRLDTGPPRVAFADGDPNGAVVASVADDLSGPAGGQVSYRRADSPSWTDLPTKFAPPAAAGGDAGKATLSAPIPALPAGTWIFRAEASDAAGNAATTILHADGTQMSIRVTAAEAAKGQVDGAAGTGSGPAGRRTKTRLFARLRGGDDGRRDGDGRRPGPAPLTYRLAADRGRGGSTTVAFGVGATLAGRLTTAHGKGLAGRSVKVVVRPSRGALAHGTVARARTGKRGGFAVKLAPGTSRRVAVSFPGSATLAPAAHRSLDLRVRSGVALAAQPPQLRTGGVVHLSGRVRSRGAPIPRRGKLVAIQYWEEDSHRWRPVLVTRTDHRGRFHARYRFRYISGAARIRLRATALAEERWPYAPGSSPAVTVEVRGG